MSPDSPLFLVSLALLEASPLWRGTSEESLRDLLTLLHRKTVPKRWSWPLDPAHDFALILKGRVKIFRSSPASDRTVTLFLLVPGDGVDVLGLLGAAPLGLTAEAIDDVVLLAAPLRDVRAWMRRHPEANASFLTYIGTRMRGLVQLATDLAIHDVEVRLANLIVRHANGGEVEAPTRLDDLSDGELAGMIGSVRAVVNRQLQSWKRRGILDSRRSSDAAERLRSIVDRGERELGRDGRGTAAPGGDVVLPRRSRLA